MDSRILLKSLIPSALALLVAACGGSSSDNGASTMSSAQELTAKVVSRDWCRNETPNNDIALIIHNDDFSTRTFIRSDSQGLLRYQGEEKKVTASILYKDLDSEGKETIRIKTYIDHPLVDMGTFYSTIQNDDACHCQSGNLDIQLPNHSGGTIVSRTFNDFIDRSWVADPLFTPQRQSLSICQVNGKWPALTVEYGYEDPVNSVAAIVPSFQFADGTAEISLDITATPARVNVFSSLGEEIDSEREIMTFVDGVRGIRNKADAGEPLYAYQNEHIDYYRAIARDVEKLYIPLLQNPVVRHFSSQFVDSIGTDIDLTLNQVAFPRLVSILDFDNGYNLADLAGYDFVSIRTIGREFRRTIFSWEINAPLSGQMPKLENFDISSFSDVDVDSFSSLQLLSIVGDYKSINGYQDFLAKRASFDFSAPVDNVANGFKASIFSSQVNTLGGLGSISSIHLAHKQAKQIED